MLWVYEELKYVGGNIMTAEEFDEKMKVVCEEFEVVWRNTSGRSNHIEK